MLDRRHDASLRDKASASARERIFRCGTHPRRLLAADCRPVGFKTERSKPWMIIIGAVIALSAGPTFAFRHGIPA